MPGGVIWPDRQVLEIANGTKPWGAVRIWDPVVKTRHWMSGATTRGASVPSDRPRVAQAPRLGLCYLPAVPTIVLNGDPRTVGDDVTVAALLRELQLDPRQVAVERNQQIVPRAHYPTETLQDNDRIEVVTFVGGG